MTFHVLVCVDLHMRLQKEELSGAFEQPPVRKEVFTSQDVWKGRRFNRC